MDLFRIRRKSKDIFEYVSDLLDGERSLLGDEADSSKQGVFEARSDIDLLLQQPLIQKRNRPRAEILFQRFTPFFEAGFCLRRSRGEWVVTNFFLYGKDFAPEDHHAAPFGLPNVKSGTVVRGRSAPILKAFRLDNLAKLADSHAFVFAAGTDHAYLLLSEKPFPWLDELIQDTQLVVDTFLT